MVLMLKKVITIITLFLILTKESDLLQAGIGNKTLWFCSTFSNFLLFCHVTFLSKNVYISTFQYFKCQLLVVRCQLLVKISTF